MFRIPRLEQQKRKEDEMEVDNNAKEKVKEENPVDSSPKCGDQIQVVISRKNIFTDHHRSKYNRFKLVSLFLSSAFFLSFNFLYYELKIISSKIFPYSADFQIVE